MRICIKTTPSSEIIDFNHLHLLTGVLHKWFGKNDFHDKTSLYSFSHLAGGDATKRGLTFKEGATFFISCWSSKLVKLLVEGIQNEPSMFLGLQVEEIVLLENPDLTNKMRFALGSPIFIQRRDENNNKKFYYYNDKEASEFLKETLETKMKIAGLPQDETLKISFDQGYFKKKIQKIDYKRGNHFTTIKSNWCPVIIEGNPESKQFAWCVGLGNSTGIGFGAIK